MGYCINLNKSTFLIKGENVLDVIKAINEFAKTRTEDLSWVDKDILEKSDDIEEIFEEFRYPLVMTEDGDYKIDDFSGEKLGDEYYIFKAISKYVENSYIELREEDGDKWRWVFKNGEMDEIYPTISW